MTFKILKIDRGSGILELGSILKGESASHAEF